ncbi:MAG: hypothetical protein OHK0036_11430 [Bacteroidia bacterium]
MISVVKRGEIYFCQFPYSDKEKFKKRPVLVLTSSDNYGDFLCVKITATYKECPVCIPITEKSLQTGSLSYPSIVVCDKITSLNEKLIGQKIAEVNDELMENVVSIIKQLF